MSEVARNPLSCTRCKSKKIKCGREEPKCDKCTVAQTSCSYPVRRQKIRRAKNRASILAEILQRLDTLEAKAGITARRQSLPENSLSFEDDGDTALLEDDDVGSDTDRSHSGTEAPLRSLYQLMNEAANTTKSMLEDDPEDTPPNQRADTLFKDALTSIRSFRWKDNKFEDDEEELSIPDETVQKWVNLCFQLSFWEQIIGPDNRSLMMSMPSIIKSPNVHAQYSVIVVYYLVLFCGWRIDEDSFSPTWKDVGQKLYRKCLKILPAWKNDGLPATTMDFIALGLLTIIAIENFDYHLGWDLHLACCSVARELKLDRLDDIDPTRRPDGYGGEAEKNSMRKRIWQLIHMEFFFRLYYDKSATLTASDFSVNMPEISVTTESVFITKEYFDLLQQNEPDLRSRVESLTDQIENLRVEWNLQGLLASPDGDLRNKWVYADLLLDGCVTIILMERKAFATKGKMDAPSPKSVRSARMALETMNLVSQISGQQLAYFMSFISFYPFMAFFTLYHHILVTLQRRQKIGKTQSVEIEKDIELMEKLVGLLEDLAAYQKEFGVIANAIATLTKASHHMLSTSVPTTPASTIPTPSSSRGVRTRSSKGRDRGDVERSLDDLSFDWTNTSGADWPRLEAGFRRHGLQTPLLYVEAMENDLFGKNWHQRWWDQ